MSEAPWLDDMLASVGVREIKGANANEKVLAYFADVGHPEYQSDENAWCAARMGSALKRAGYPIPPVNINLTARSYLTYGVACDPKRGAIIVMKRGKSTWEGHVGCVVSVMLDRVTYVAGNQSDAVGYGEIDISDPRVLGFRWPVQATVADLRKSGSTEIKKADRIQNSGWLSLLITAITATWAELTAPIRSVAIPDALPDVLTWGQTILGGLNAVGELVLEHPYIAGSAFITLVCFLVDRNIKKARVAKHAAGIPLSTEVAALVEA